MYVYICVGTVQSIEKISCRSWHHFTPMGIQGWTQIINFNDKRLLLTLFIDHKCLFLKCYLHYRQLVIKVKNDCGFNFVFDHLKINNQLTYMDCIWHNITWMIVAISFHYQTVLFIVLWQYSLLLYTNPFRTPVFLYILYPHLSPTIFIQKSYCTYKQELWKLQDIVLPHV